MSNNINFPLTKKYINTYSSRSAYNISCECCQYYISQKIEILKLSNKRHVRFFTELEITNNLVINISGIPVIC